MIYKLRTSFRMCRAIGFKWEMVDSIEEATKEEIKSIKRKLKPHNERTGITWDQYEILTDGTRVTRRTFIVIPDKILEIRDTPLVKTVYIESKSVTDLLKQAVTQGEARYEV